MGLPIMGAGGIADVAVGVGIGVAGLAGATIPAMLRCMDLDALGLVYFDFNPEQIVMRRQPKLQQAPSTGAAAGRPAVAIADPPTINLKTLLIGWDTKMRVDTLLAWTAPPAGLATMIAGALGADINSTKLPDLTFQWGPPMVGFMYTVNLTNVSAQYTRFDSTGIPIRAMVTIDMKVLPSDLFGALPTNPTSGGLPGRNTHLVRENESLQSIAQQYYGKPGVWRKIAEINGITDPRRVRPGTTLYLPAASELSPAGSR